MKISEAEVRYVAKLANLELSDDEVSRFSSQLSHILDHVEALKEVPTENVDSLMQVVPTEGAPFSSTPLREDSPRKSLGAETAVSNAPDSTASYFKVPKVIADR